MNLKYVWNVKVCVSPSLLADPWHTSQRAPQKRGPGVGPPHPTGVPTEGGPMEEGTGRAAGRVLISLMV